MSAHASLLVELLVEELPPKALKTLGEAFAWTLEQSLKAQGFADARSVATSFATPRRLGLHLSHVAPWAADKAVSHKLMPVSVGLDAKGQATPALLKKLAALGFEGIDLNKLKRVLEGKAESLYFETVQAGIDLRHGLQEALQQALAKLPIPKVMTYQLADGWTSVNFVRPVHGLIALHGAALVPVSCLGVEAGRQTKGHRFEASVDPVMVLDADHYERQLREQGAVIASFAGRRLEIQRQLQAAAGKLGLTPIQDEALLDEVTALVERPKVLTCQFEREFLDVPQEVLILTMKANQKYFPLLDTANKLTHQFLVVSNIDPADPSQVIQGNERVVRPRLADAKFFFEQDRKKTLAHRVPGLEKVVYHGKLGSQGARSERVRAITHVIVKHLSLGITPWTTLAHDEMDLLAHKADLAARLAKVDLLTDMVGEFPELQGVMGGYYARLEGQRDGVALAIEDHYKPRFAGDALPRNHTGTVLALADKLETLVGLFGIGQTPTGDKDPFALRRHALGVIRLILEKHLPLDLRTLVSAVVPVFGDLINDPTAALLDFMRERLAVSLRDQGASAHEVDAVLALQATQWVSVPKRLAAVRAFAALPEAASLAAANKRVANILKKVESAPRGEVQEALLTEAAEGALFAALGPAEAAAQTALAAGDYTASLKSLAVLKTPVDAFFEHVMVNADDPALRANRLALLNRLHQTMNQVADLSRLAPA